MLQLALQGDIVSWINCILLGLNKEIKAQCPKPDKCWGEIAKEKKAPDGQTSKNVNKSMIMPGILCT